MQVIYYILSMKQREIAILSRAIPKLTRANPKSFSDCVNSLSTIELYLYLKNSDALKDQGDIINSPVFKFQLILEAPDELTVTHEKGYITAESVSVMCSHDAETGDQEESEFRSTRTYNLVDDINTKYFKLMHKTFGTDNQPYLPILINQVFKNHDNRRDFDSSYSYASMIYDVLSDKVYLTDFTTPAEKDFDIKKCIYIASKVGFKQLVELRNRLKSKGVKPGDFNIL